MRALCPFHPDRHPSLAVNLQTGGFYCFSCGERGGGLIDFLMNDGVSFKEALPAAFLIPASTGQVLSPRRKTALRYTALVRVINAGRATTASLIRT